MISLIRKNRGKRIINVNDRGFSELLRGNNRVQYQIKPNDVIHNFRVKSIQDHPEFSIKSFVLEHQKTKTSYIHLDTSDTNNSFAAVIKTLPENSRGSINIKQNKPNKVEKSIKQRILK